MGNCVNSAMAENQDNKELTNIKYILINKNIIVLEI